MNFALPSPVAASAPPPRLSAGRIGAFAIVVFGIFSTEALSANLLPLTLRRHTLDAFTIGAILALNPLFGFIGQPLASYWGDRIWTRFGRRAIFMIVAAPLVATCLVFIPFARELWQVALLVAAYQFFQDILCGAYPPLLAELAPRWQRALVAGVMTVASQLAVMFVVRFGLGWVQAHETAEGGANFGLPLYWLCACIQIGCVAGGALLLREPIPRHPAPTEVFSFRRYFAILREHRPLRLLAGIQACRGFLIAATIDFNILFATVTLNLETARFGAIAGWAPLVGMLTVPPAIWLNDRVPRHVIMSVAFGFLALACILCLATTSAWPFAIALWLAAMMHATHHTTFRAFSSEFYPPGRFGQASGAIHVFFGAGRVVGVLMVGKIISLSGNNYRYAYAAGLACGLLGAIVALRLPDHRRRAGRTADSTEIHP